MRFIVFFRCCNKPIIVSIFVLLCHFHIHLAAIDLTIVGKVNTGQGIGLIAPTIAKCVYPELDISFINTRPHETNYSGLSNELVNVLTKTHTPKRDIAIFTDVLWNGFEDHNYKKVPKATIKFAYSMLESTKIPKEWVTILNQRFDAVIVPHKFLIKVYTNSGVKIPIFILPLPLQSIYKLQENFYLDLINNITYSHFDFISKQIKRFGTKVLYLTGCKKIQPITLAINKYGLNIFKYFHNLVSDSKEKKLMSCEATFDEMRPFIFGCVAGFGQRKNQRLLVQAFAEAFGNSPQFKLKLHSHLSFNNEVDYIKRMISELGLNNVELSTTERSYEDYLDFLRSLDCFILISKGEGYSITPREALCLQIPCILSNNTAHHEMCCLPSVISVETKKIEPAFYENLGNRYLGYQYNCNVLDVINAMKQMYENYYSYVKQTDKGFNWVKRFKIAKLKKKYLALLKPNSLTLSHKNKIGDKTLFINSQRLYKKFCKLYPHLKTKKIKPQRKVSL
jgi:glycosyltransferase involved in cell wall biosynthesis